jgi:adenosylhomocysteine nucleosidase
LKTVGVVAALGAEARALGRSRPHRAQAAKFGNLAYLADGSMLAVSGIGLPAAAAAADALVDAGVSSLMTFGMAGGLDPRLATGTLLLPRAVLTADGERFATAEAWREQLCASLAAHGRIEQGELLTSAFAIATVADKAAAQRSSGAVAVDMESVAVARVALRHELPFVCVRVVVDAAADALPRTVVAASRAGGVRVARLLLGLVRAPGDIGGLLGLMGRYRVAMRVLKVIARSGPLAPSR